jgi:multimeric flavodoxin WrbA
MSIVVVYFSGYGHTSLVAENVAAGASAELIAINENGEITESDWQKLNDAKAIIFGAPTYMGGVPWQFKSSLMPPLKRGLPVAGRIKFLRVSATAPA